MKRQQHNNGLHDTAVQHNTAQPPSTSKFTACQGHFVMLCVDAAGRECPSLSFSLAPSPSLSFAFDNLILLVFIALS